MLEHIGASLGTPESEEVLSFHASVLLYQLESLHGLNSYHQMFPWRWIEMLDPTRWTEVLREARRIWEFVIGCVDQLQPNEALYHEMSITRHQNFRDVLTKAECLGLLFGMFLFFMFMDLLLTH